MFAFTSNTQHSTSTQKEDSGVGGGRIMSSFPKDVHILVLEPVNRLGDMTGEFKLQIELTLLIS